jgi:Arc/MetJ-type ribon-helix-helix transcriptional regulator
MRKVLSISVTSVLERDIKQKTKKRGFNSVSDYIKNLVVADEDLISEEELLEEIRRGEEEYEKGDVVRGKRLSDFI